MIPSSNQKQKLGLPAVQVFCLEQEAAGHQHEASYTSLLLSTDQQVPWWRGEQDWGSCNPLHLSKTSKNAFVAGNYESREERQSRGKDFMLTIIYIPISSQTF